MKLRNHFITIVFFHTYVFLRNIWKTLGGPAHVCSFYPTCGQYVRNVFRHQPLHRALVLSMVRIARCHPWHKGEVHLPPKHAPLS